VRTYALDLVKKLRARVRMLHTDHTATGREKVKRFLERFKAGCIFCHVATGEKDGLGAVDKEYRELVQEVKEEEGKYQGKQNTELEFKFSKLQGEFRDALITRADREIKEAACGGGGDALTTRADREINEALDEEPTRHDVVFIPRMAQRLTQALGTTPFSVHFLWSYASLIFSREVLDKFVSDCEKGSDILGWFRDVENIAKERREQCVNGCVLSCLSQSINSLKLIY
jgi:hypothetical protein